MSLHVNVFQLLLCRLLSDCADTGRVRPPVAEELEGDRAATAGVHSHIHQAGVEFLRVQVVSDGHQQQLEVVSIDLSPNKYIIIRSLM